MNKNRYRIKEGDILKLGRVWIIIRAINIPLKKLKNKRVEIKDTDCNMVSHHHNQGNQSLNIKDDFNEENNLYANYSEESDDSSDSEKKEKEKNNNKNKLINSLDENKNKNNKNNKDINNKKEIEEKNSYSNIQKICRICYLEEDNPLLNPLIKPCKCIGSTKYIHLKCLIHWLKTKVEIDNSDYLDNGKYKLYSSEKVECELCKAVFPDYIKHKNRLYNLMDFEQNFGDEEEDNNENNNITVTEGLINRRDIDNNNYNNYNNESNNLRKRKKDEESVKYKINPKKDTYIVVDSFIFEKNARN